MLHVGRHVRFTPPLVPAKLSEDGKKVLEPELQPDNVTAMVTKVHGASCVNLVVLEDGDYAGQRFTSVSAGSGPHSFGFLPRSAYASPL